MGDIFGNLFIFENFSEIEKVAMDKALKMFLIEIRKGAHQVQAESFPTFV